MRARNFLAGVAIAMALPLAVAAQQMPQIKSCSPTTAKPGAVVTVAGENLGKANIDKLYLTDGNNDTVVAIQQQGDTELKVKVPDKMALGRFAFLILTKGEEPKLIEQPVKLNVSDKEPEPEPAPEPAAPPQEPPATPPAPPQK